MRVRRPAVIGLSVLALVGSAWGVGALVDRPETAAAVIDAGGATTPTAPVRVAAVAAPTTPPAPAPSTTPVAPVGAGPDAAPMPPVSALDAETQRWLAEQVTPDPESALNPTILDADDIDAAYDALTPPG